MEISVIIDWISTTDTKTEVSENPNKRLLKDGAWVECKGANGYTLGQKHSTGVRQYINLDRPDMGRHTIYSGRTLSRIRAEMDITQSDILIHHINEGHNIARLDVAIDFKGYGLEVSEFINAFRNGKVKTKLRKATVVKSLVGEGETLYIGSMKKRKNLVRIYNKGAETGTGEDWIRVELQIMGKKATSIGMAIAQSYDIKQAIMGVILAVVDFPTVPLWTALTGKTETMTMPSFPKEHGDTEKWLMKTCIPSLAKAIVLDWDFWIKFQLALLEELPEDISDRLQADR